MSPHKKVIVCQANTRFWYLKSEEEIDRRRTEDQRVGRHLDDAGETILYSAIGSGSLREPTVVTITRRRNVPWPHWSKKPKHLVEGIATVDGVPRLVMISLPVQTRGDT